MANNNIEQFANNAQDVARSVYGAMQGIAEVQFNIMQRLGEVQQRVIRQAYEASNEQLQLVSRVRGPKAFAFAQAELVKTHGQRYVDSVKQATDVTAEAWQEYGDRLEQGANSIAHKTQRAASPKNGTASSKKAA
jgi:hypothetical protein